MKNIFDAELEIIQFNVNDIITPLATLTMQTIYLMVTNSSANNIRK